MVVVVVVVPLPSIRSSSILPHGWSQSTQMAGVVVWRCLEPTIFITSTCGGGNDSVVFK